MTTKLHYFAKIYKDFDLPPYSILLCYSNGIPIGQKYVRFAWTAKGAEKKALALMKKYEKSLTPKKDLWRIYPDVDNNKSV